MGEIGVHDDHKGPRGVLESVDVGGTQTKFAGTGFEDDAASVEILELLSYLQGAIRGAVIDDDYFPVEVAGRVKGVSILQGGMK